MNPQRDIEISKNNGVLAVRIVSTGRLRSLQQNLKVREGDEIIEGDPRVWVFATGVIWADNEGNERICHHLRGLLAGSYKDGEEFLRHSKMVGFEVEYAGFYVPLSRGERTIVVGQQPYADFPLNEQLMVRSDQPPTLQQLLDIISQEMGEAV